MERMLKFRRSTNITRSTKSKALDIKKVLIRKEKKKRTVKDQNPQYLGGVKQP